MATVSELRQQISQARQQVQSERQRASEAQQQTVQVRESLPKTTEQSLRGGMFTGLSGRQTLRKVQDVKEQTISQEKIIEGYQKELSDYEAQIAATEQDVEQFEQGQRQAESYNYALQAYLGLTSGANLSSVDPEIRREAQKKAEEIERGAVRESNIEIKKEFESLNPSEKLIFDPTKTKMLSVESGAIGETIPISEYNKRVEEYNKSIAEPTLSPETPSGIVQKPLSISDARTDPPITSIRPPSIKGKYKQLAKEVGYVKAVPALIGQYAEDYYRKTEKPQKILAIEQYTPVELRGTTTELSREEKEKRIQERFDITAKGFGQAVSSAPYFYPPLAATLLISGGAEDFATKAGRERLAARETALSEKFNPIISKAIAYGLPAVEIGLGLLGAKQIYARTKAPLRTVEQLRPVKEPKIAVLSRDVIINGRRLPAYRYTIKGEIKPPTRVVETTRLRQALYLPPKKITYKPAKTYVQKTLTPSIADRPFFVGEYRSGTKYITVSKIGGTSQPISLSQFKNLPKQVQYIQQKMVEYNLGRPVPLKLVPKVARQDVTRSLADIEAIKGVRVAKVGANKIDLRTKFFKEGKSTTRSQAIGEFKALKESQDYQLYGVKIGSKDVTKPFSRARGDIPIVRGFEVRIKEPFTVQVPQPSSELIFTVRKATARFMQPADITKTPLSKTFGTPSRPDTLLDQISRTMQSEVTVPKVALPKVATIKTTVAVKSSPVVITTTPVLASALLQRPTTKQDQQQLVVVKQADVQTQEPKLDQPLIPKVTTKVSQSSLSGQAQVPVEAQIVIPKLAQAEVQVPKLETGQAQASATSTTFQRPRTPKQPPPAKIPSLEAKGSKSIKLLKIPKERILEILVRKAKKDVKIAEAINIKKATDILRANLKATLRASGFVRAKATQKPLRFEELGLADSEFAPSKKDSFRVIQRKQYRLGTRGETKELQYFKRATKGGIF